MPSYVGAIDQGTTSTRFIVFDKSGRIVSSAQKEHEQIYPKPGWVEHDPEEIWRRTQEVIAEAMAKAALRPKDLAAIGITNQRETTVVWNRKTGSPVHNAIVWQDTRVADAVAEFSRRGGQDRFRKKTGLPLATYFSGLKLRWILNDVPGIRRQAEAGDVVFGNIDTFLLWKLTGGAAGGIHATDVTNASRTQLLDLKTLSWDREILRLYGIPEAMLPQIRSSSEVYGNARIDSIKDVPIAGILGDQQAALVGQACFKPGEAKNTYGTGCFLLMNTGHKPVQSRSGLLTTVAYKLGNKPAQYALEGSIAITGALVQWLRDNLGIIDKSSSIEALARTVDDNGGVYFVPAFSGLYAPYWKAAARGVIAGLTRYANKGHLARAALEATAFQTREVVEAMETDSRIKLHVLCTDGGMVENELLMQFQADILNRSVVRPVVRETTALGASYAAGLAVGFFKDTEELRSHWAVDRTWQPQMKKGTRDHLFRFWKKAVTRSFDWIDEPSSGSRRGSRRMKRSLRRDGLT
ncbi:MAG TPA: glycerol kinase GlpK [Candidatus Acidoferrum sp.]|nr:glycerol kinase GlpK [Candidatus Acidoferrum sp.]